MLLFQVPDEGCVVVLAFIFRVIRLLDIFMKCLWRHYSFKLTYGIKVVKIALNDIGPAAVLTIPALVLPIPESDIPQSVISVFRDGLVRCHRLRSSNSVSWKKSNPMESYEQD